MIDNNKGNNKHYKYNDIYIYLKEISNFEFLISNYAKQIRIYFILIHRQRRSPFPYLGEG